MVDSIVDKNHLILLPLTVIVVFSLQFSSLIVPQEAEGQRMESCITFDSTENIIRISCENATFSDILNTINDPSILSSETSEYNSKIWLLNSGIKVEKYATLDITSDDIDWLKIVPGVNTPNAISVSGSLYVDSVKITSWNPKTDDYVKFSEAVKYNDEVYSKELRPYIKTSSSATGPTEIYNSELAYLGYSGGGTGGVTFNGGDGSILKDNDIHHIYKGFYSKGMSNMLIEGNKIHDNEKYGIDPHSGTNNMVIRNNIVYDNYNAGIICSADCYNIIIEGNEVFNNGHGDNKRGIAVSKNVHDSIIRNNLVYNEDKCISIGRDSHSNQVYDNFLADCLNGVYVKNSYNNEIYDNYIENVGYGLVTTDGSSKNSFNSNTIVGAQINKISQDSDSTDNIFNDNKIESFNTLE